MQRRFLAVSLLLVIIGGMFLTGCSSNTESNAKPAVQTVKGTLTDTSIRLSSSSVSSGKVTFAITNNGTLEHEFVVLKTDLAPDAVHMQSDAEKVDEDMSGENVGEVEGIASGETKELSLSLQPGKYLLICNLPGHFQAGMYVSFEVQ